MSTISTILKRCMILCAIGTMVVLPMKASSISFVGDTAFVNYKPYVSLVNRSPMTVIMETMIPMMVYDASYSSSDHLMRDVRHHYFPSGGWTRVDDYIQYLPLTAIWGMRMAGMKGRSQTMTEMAVAQLSSMILTTGMVKAAKFAFRRIRPDNSANNAFPSGHTATAFAIAAMMDAEYGEDSPWLVGTCYGLATTTGILRIANNRHWSTDVITGAGIGMGATYLGYWLSDVIFKRDRHYGHIGDYDEEGSLLSLSLEHAMSSILMEASDYRASTSAKISSVSVRVPVYQRWGLHTQVGVIHSYDTKTSEFLDAYALMGGASYMHPLLSGRLWLEGFCDLGYLSEARLSHTTGHEVYRPNATPLTASAVALKVGATSTILTRPHFGLRLGLSYWMAPTAQPYDRSYRSGYKGFEGSVGVSYIFQN